MDEAARAAERPFHGRRAPRPSEQLDGLLRDAVRLRRWIADVPLGAFLSGGIDSSTVVALMQARARAARRARFSIGFDEPALRRGAHAPRASPGTWAPSTPSSMCATRMRSRRAAAPAGDLRRAVRRRLADPDLAASPQLRAAHVTVGLSGDGGDELFGGYPRYQEAARRWRAHCRDAAPRCAAWPGVAAGHLPGGSSRALSRLSRRLEEMAAGDAVGFYRAYVSRWRAARDLVPGARPSDAVSDGARAPALGIARIAVHGARCGRPICPTTSWSRSTGRPWRSASRPVCRCSTTASSSSPGRLPDRFKIRGGTGKWLLRQVLARYVPRELCERPKQGFEPAGWGLAARAAARLGRGPARREAAARGGIHRSRAGAPALGRARLGPARLALRAMERADVPGLARPLAGALSGGRRAEGRRQAARTFWRNPPTSPCRP